MEDFNWEYSIPSNSGLVFTLSNGEFVIIPSHLKPDVPCMIISDKSQFLKFIEQDFFPIGNENMTWMELHAPEIKKFGSGFMSEDTSINSALGIKAPFRDSEEIQSSFEKLRMYIRSTIENKKQVSAAVNAFGLAVTEYLITVKKYAWELQKRYETYNPYYYPVIIVDGKRINTISKLYIALDSHSEASYSLFSRFVSL